MAQPILPSKDLHKPISNRNATNREVITVETAVEEPKLITTFPEKASEISSFEDRSRFVSKIDTSDMPDDIVRDAAVGSFGTGRQLEVVIGDDDRELVQNTMDSPWRKIAALRIKGANGLTYVGTGWFISPTVLATAGHCVFMHDAGGWPRQIEVTKFESSNGWINDRNSDYDYGAIILDKPISEDIGWFAFAAAPDEYLKSNIANISGYPADRDKAMKQYYHARNITRASSRRIYYEIDTYGGDSGAAVWMNIGENNRVVIGVHTNGSSTSNFGTRITDEVYKNLQTWKKL
jgi:V8-like Glu-specific endopeptidase